MSGSGDSPVLTIQSLHNVKEFLVRSLNPSRRESVAPRMMLRRLLEAIIPVCISRVNEVVNANDASSSVHGQPNQIHASDFVAGTTGSLPP